ncbi:SDR family oxidoreductase [Micromonospora rifamycinica]|uniref:Short-chain dehydrogenase n=1 Tax=Micromonospora rifamycinica TaxID=291594 RepID=A0A109IN79_9ACTN|nr:SDR family oxidoreductase [Micromonospora rifamycinica]KWV33641.1 short-chain dehydrogenase [Micromonospora rifamycinica]SCG46910.1 Short-chain dehydrogenase [Micromonospora rifamycinica]
MTVPTRTWLVTGSSAGLGRALVTELLARGETVAATARDPQALSDLRPAVSGTLWTARLDVTDPERIRRVVGEAVHALGRIDVVLSNAGYALVGAAEEASPDQIERQLRTNLTGPILLARAVLPYLRAQGHGRIVQISSMAGQRGSAGTAVYCASKWGVEGFFESLAAEVKTFGIGVTIVEPGTVHTGFFGRGKELTAALPAYADTPAAILRRRAEDGRLPCRGDLAKMARAVVDVALRPTAPLRVVLGSDAYGSIRRGLTARLADLEAQREVAFSTDLTDGSA